MTSFLVGIIILIVVALALGRSLLAGRAGGQLPGDGDYAHDPVIDAEPAWTGPPGRGRTDDPAAMIDDFVVRDAVGEEHDLTCAGDDDGGPAR